MNASERFGLCAAKLRTRAPARIRPPSRRYSLATPHRLLFRAIFPKVRPRMIRYMKIYPAEAETARGRTTSTMDRIERELQPSGYLVGDHFTVADLTAAALL
jgi:glutathione S-transferase